MGGERELVTLVVLPTYVFYMKGACVSLTSCQGEISHEICFSPEFSPLPHKDDGKFSDDGFTGSSCIAGSQENTDGKVGQQRQSVES